MGLCSFEGSRINPSENTLFRAHTSIAKQFLAKFPIHWLPWCLLAVVKWPVREAAYRLHQVPSSAWSCASAFRCRNALRWIEYKIASSRSGQKARCSFRDGAVHIVTRLRSGRRGSIPGRNRNFTVRRHVQTGYGANSYWGSFHAGKAAGVLSWEFRPALRGRMHGATQHSSVRFIRVTAS